MTAVVRAMGFDQMRLQRPLAAAAAAAGVHLQWELRPRAAFDAPALEQLCAEFDLLLLHQSEIGAAACSGLIVPVDEWAGAVDRSVGRADAAFSRRGRMWAVPIDVSCLLGAVRADLWHGAALGRLPGNWDEVADLAIERSRSTSRVALPLDPAGAYTAFISLCMCLGGQRFWPRGDSINPAAGTDALVFLRKLAASLHPASRSDDAAALRQRMRRDDEILYVPLLPGDAQCTRPVSGLHALQFMPAPRGTAGHAGSVLDASGLALPARASPAAAAQARALLAPEIQCGPYALAGGQPALRAAWESQQVNGAHGHFHAAALATMEQAFLLPPVPGHRWFQPRAGELLHRYIWSPCMTARECLAGFTYLVDTLLPEWIGNGCRRDDDAG